jgi:ATP-dependent RNA helicase DeaD
MPETPSSFSALGLSADIVSVLDALGYEAPTPIQAQAIPLLLAGRDVLGSAATGTGKTAAFALPMVERLERSQRSVQGLVLAPTRELAIQVAEAIHRYGAKRRVTVLPIYGGQPIQRQLQMLKRGVQIVVGTPGRVLDHLRRGSLTLSAVRHVVLDEADEMLDMGFADDLEAILQQTPAERQTALFSATFPPRLNALVRRYLRDAERVAITAEVRRTPRVRQVAYTVTRPHKLEALGRILDVESPASAIVFCRTRTEVDDLSAALAAHGYSPEALHGGFAQTQRDRVMNRFRQGTADILIATDVAARGLDVEHVSHVINYDIPESPEVYVHRIGRTGRAGREGVAITLVQPREHYLLAAIERVVKQRIERASLPSAADVRARRIEALASAVRETLIAGDFGRYRAAVRILTEEFDPLDVAAAAAKLAAEALHGPEVEAAGEKPVDEPAAGFRQMQTERAPRERARSVRSENGTRQSESAESARDERARSGAARPERRTATPSKHERLPPAARDGSQPPKRRRPTDTMVRLVITAGEQRGIRPKDLVGAIAGEADIPGSSIGAIEVGERHSTVEVPASLADRVIRALSKATLKGQRVSARREKR